MKKITLSFLIPISVIVGFFASCMTGCRPGGTIFSEPPMPHTVTCWGSSATKMFSMNVVDKPSFSSEFKVRLTTGQDIEIHIGDATCVAVPGIETPTQTAPTPPSAAPTHEAPKPDAGPQEKTK